MSIFDRLATMVRDDGRAVLVTLASVEGSSPRDVGARMAVRADGAFAGTIGGGTLEWQALAEAQALLATATGNSLRRMDRALGPDLGQCCGGRVRLTFERFGPEDLDWLRDLARALALGAKVSIGMPTAAGHFQRRAATPDESALLPDGEERVVLADGTIFERVTAPSTPVLLFGAGHVGRALVMALAPLPFRVRWIDPRPDAFPAHVPANVTVVHATDPTQELVQTSGDLGGLVQASGPGEEFVQTSHAGIVLVMTHSHALDLEIAMAALNLRRFSYVGVIGSATKRARFLSQMRQAGLDDALAATLVCPIGLPEIGGKEPAVIAASVVAQILPRRHDLRVRHRDVPTTRAGQRD